jgi:hypothetical protein
MTMITPHPTARVFAGTALTLLSSAILLLTASGCSSSSVVDTWRDPAYTDPPMKDILVIAVKKDPSRRRNWEDGFVGELSQYGVRATSSYTLFPSAIPDTATVIQSVRERGFDGVLVVRRIQSDTTTTYIEGYTTAEPVTRYDPWSNTYSSYFREIQHPGYTEIETRSRHEVNVWHAGNGGKLVWAGVGEALDSGAPNSDIREEIINLVCPDMSEAGLIPAKK